MRRELIFSMAAAALLLWAHPHEWITVVVHPELNVSGSIAALQEEWQFDPLGAELMLEDVLNAPDNAAQARAMAATEAQISASLQEQGSYTYADSPAAFAPAEAQRLTVEDGILTFRFRLPLQKAVKTLDFRIYEPSYYIEMRYDEDRQPTKFANGCRLHIRESKPSPAMVDAAYAIDQTGKGDAQLGSYFAQLSHIECGK